MTKRYHLFQRDRNRNYHYVDKVSKTFIEMGGCLLNIYPLLGVVKKDGTVIPIDSKTDTIIGDAVLNENNKRKYSHTTYDLWATTTMNPAQFSWSYAGISILDGDVKEFSLHYNSMIAALGRKLIVGDVIEMTWLRDLDILGSDKAQNRFYVVSESARDESGWGPEWHYHLWKIKCKPITNSPEFSDLFNKEDPLEGGEDGFYEPPGSELGGGGLDIDGTQDNGLDKIVDETLKEADGEDGSPENGWQTSGVSYRLHDEHHVFLKINDKYYIGDKPNIVGIDGIPAELTCDEVPFGEGFPKYSEENDYFLRTDYEPPRLYKRVYTKNMKNILNIRFDDIVVSDAILKITGNNFDGSITENDRLVGHIKSDRVYIDGTYVGYTTDNGKIVANSGVIIGNIKVEEEISRKGWKLEELDHRERWTGVPSVLRNVINNENTFINEEGDVENMRQNIKDLVKARVKKEHYEPRPWNKEMQKEIENEKGTHFKIIGITYPGEDERLNNS